jgi:hypothetical protein
MPYTMSMVSHTGELGEERDPIRKEEEEAAPATEASEVAAASFKATPKP